MNDSGNFFKSCNDVILSNFIIYNKAIIALRVKFHLKNWTFYGISKKSFIFSLNFNFFAIFDKNICNEKFKKKYLTIVF